MLGPPSRWSAFYFSPLIGFLKYVHFKGTIMIMNGAMEGVAGKLCRYSSRVMIYSIFYRIWACKRSELQCRSV